MKNTIQQQFFSILQPIAVCIMIAIGLFFIVFSLPGVYATNHSARIATAPLQVGVATTDVSCNNYSDGTINLTVTGGTPPYSFLWNDGVTTKNRSGLPAGSYSVTVSDQNSSVPDNITINQPPPVAIDLGNDLTACAGTGVVLHAGAGYIDYLWNTGSNSAVYTVTVPGRYSVQVTDANGCTGSDETIVTFYPFTGGEANYWYFGQNAGINFNTNPPTVLSGGAINTYEGCATISNRDGELLFYTDGITVWDKTHNSMSNGTGLNGDASSTQSGVIVPKPGSATLFYVFTVAAEAEDAGLQYSVVDITQNGGLGDVVIKNQQLDAPVCEKITAIRHKNNFDVWIVAHRWNSNEFITYLLTDKGLSTNPVISATGETHSKAPDDSPNWLGYMKASPAGDKLALAISFRNIVELFDFDNETGIITNPLQLQYPDDDLPYGLEFSPDGSRFYVGVFRKLIRQYDLTAGSHEAIRQTETIIGNSSNLQVGALQLAPDGKIYVTKDMSPSLGIIQNPAGLGGDCNYIDQGIALGAQTRLGLTNFVQSYFAVPGFRYEAGCANEAVSFSIYNANNIVSVKWNFGDGTISTDLSPTHTYATTGTFKVELIIDQVCETNTIEKHITIQPPPTPDLGVDRDILIGESVTLNPGDFFSYQWNTGNQTPFLDVSVTGLYSVAVTDKYGCTASDDVSVTVRDATIDFDFQYTCHEQDTKFNLISDVPVEQVLWNFNDPLSHQNTSGETNPEHEFSFSGNYDVSVTVHYFGRLKTITKTVTIHPQPRPNLGRGNGAGYTYHFVNAGSVVTLDPGAFTSYSWSTGETTRTIDISVTGSYFVDVTDQNGCRGHDGVQVEISDPTVGFYDIESNSPYNCSDVLDLKAFNHQDAWGHIVPGFTITIQPDEHSESENYIEFYKNREFFVEFPISTFHYHVTHYIIGQYMNPDDEWHVQWCDKNSTGVFPYVVQDHSNMETTERGIFDNNGVSCDSAYIGKAKGIAVFSGPGVTNHFDGEGTFDAATAGPGIHEIKYCWDNEVDFSGCATQTIEVLAPFANAGDDKNICKGESVQIGGNPSASGGAGDFTYLWTPATGLDDPAVANPVASPESTTVYKLTVLDAGGNGCFATDDVTVTVYSPPLAQITTTQTCQHNDITLQPNPQEGSGSIVSHKWTGDINPLSNTTIANPVFLANSSGVYQLNYTVTDDNNCATTVSADFTVYQGVDVHLGKDTLLCFDNQFTLDATTPQATAYLWNTGDNTTTFTVQQSGNYAVQVTDLHGCVGSDEISVSFTPEILIQDIDVQNVQCYGTWDGEITLLASGGYNQLYFSLNNQPKQTLTSFQQLIPGEYKITVSDDYGCSIQTSNLQINAPDRLEITSVIKNDVQGCFGNNNASITLNAGGGTGNLQYSIDNGSHFIDNPYFSSLQSGTYYPVVKDDNNCTASAQAINILQPKTIQIITIEAKDVRCHNQGNGKIDVTAVGGTGTLQYKLVYADNLSDATGFQDNGSFRNIADGEYRIKIKDQNQCTILSDSIFCIKNPPELQIISESMDEIVCYNAANGKIQIEATGGTGELYYRLNQAEYQDSGVFVNLPADRYTITVKDANNCTLTSSKSHLLINPPEIIIKNEQITAIDCYDANNGTLTVEARGGIGELEYRLNNFEFQKDTYFSQLTSGEYQVSVRDARGCLITSPEIHTLNNPKQIMLSVNISPVRCHNEQNGQITAHANGGTGDLLYQLNDNDFQVENIFPFLRAGNYRIMVKDANQCIISSDEIVLKNPSDIIIDEIDFQNITCHGEESGQITVRAYGGSSELLYQLNNNQFQGEPIFNNLPANNYSVTIKDSNECYMQSDKIISVTEPPAIVIESEDATKISCYNAGDAKITVNAYGGTPPLKYQLNDNTPQSGNEFPNLSAGNYRIGIVDAAGCKTTSPLLHSIDNPEQIILDIEKTKIACHNDKNGKILIKAGGGIGHLTYKLQNNENGFTVVQDYPAFDTLGWGNYTITITDAKNCSVKQNVQLENPPQLQISITDSLMTCIGYSEGSFGYEISGGTGYISTSIVNQNDEILVQTDNLPPGTYTLYAEDANTCIDSTRVKIIEVECLSEMEIPNIFTPNGDARNDYFRIKAKNITSYQCIIFNRWGERVHETTAINPGWNGYIKNHRKASEGVYYYHIIATGKDNKRYNFSGFLHLMR